MMSSRVSKSKSKSKRSSDKYKLKRAPRTFVSLTSSAKRNYKSKYVSLSPNTQILNKGREKVITIKSTQRANQIFGAGAATFQCLSFTPNAGINSGVGNAPYSMPNFNKFTALFKQYKVNYIDVTFKLINLELTDNAIIPQIYIRSFDDPDIVTIDEAKMKKLRNVLRHTFNGNDLLVTYRVYPRTLYAVRDWNTSNFVTKSKKASWQDTTPTGPVPTDGVAHYGLLYYIPNLASGMTIDMDYSWNVSFREQAEA